MVAHRRGGLFEGLGFDRPDDQVCAGQKGAGFGLRLQAEIGCQPGASVCPGFDHIDVCGRKPLAEQPADDGAGHIAAADECNALAHAESCALKSQSARV